MPTGELFARRTGLAITVRRAAVQVVLFIPFTPGAVNGLSVADALKTQDGFSMPPGDGTAAQLAQFRGARGVFYRHNSDRTISRMIDDVLVFVIRARFSMMSASSRGSRTHIVFVPLSDIGTGPRFSPFSGFFVVGMVFSPMIFRGYYKDGNLSSVFFPALSGKNVINRGCEDFRHLRPFLFKNAVPDLN